MRRLGFHGARSNLHHLGQECVTGLSGTFDGQFGGFSVSGIHRCPQTVAIESEHASEGIPGEPASSEISYQWNHSRAAA